MPQGVGQGHQERQSRPNGFLQAQVPDSTSNHGGGRYSTRERQLVPTPAWKNTSQRYDEKSRRLTNGHFPWPRTENHRTVANERTTDTHEEGALTTPTNREYALRRHYAAARVPSHRTKHHRSRRRRPTHVQIAQHHPSKPTKRATPN